MTELAVDRPLSRALAARSGITPTELAGPLWRSPYRNVHVWFGQDAEDPRQRILAAAAALPAGAALGGWAAAYLQGARELDGLGPDGTTRQPLLVCLSPPAQIRRRSDLWPFRSALDDEDVVVVDGVLVTTPVRTAYDLARLSAFPGLTCAPASSALAEGVAGTDAVLRATATPLGDVVDYAARRPRWRGSRQARRVLALADPRARSRGESRLRVLWIIAAGLPRPEVNPDVFDGAGQLLGIPDLLDVAVGLAGEYDGEVHRSLERHTTDNAREEWLEHAGLLVVRATSLDLGRYRARTVHRLRAGHARATAQTRAGALNGALNGAGGRGWLWRASPLP